MIRLPINQPARMTISISDETGTILALYRMPDGTVFSSDVAMTKARNAYYFSTREGYERCGVGTSGDSAVDRATWRIERAASEKISDRSRPHGTSILRDDACRGTAWRSPT